ncbi:MAG: alternative ribosome rescue aminoacyl-tRNA hydrolase ArfB [Candidatus Electrothrix aestuarii]|uniref:Alternative ribosome rescue aminoacyl-tRNA hydrolase ArfB n=1 Tax=Candidatus Electrothrix aestuarii TaxID=3062594 RepID=A0AAU8LU06_9BACT|nr:alternative ribosome rescue aminoacyl-tRNA hydrolase ArfB [Candidatus Electrothrix aestuarii]
MDKQDQYRITTSCIIPAAELFFSYSRSSGKGGQHVNKVNTKVSLIFDLEASPSLTEEQKTLLKQRLGNRLNKQGILRLDGDRQRSQRGNQEEVIQRFISLLRDALYIQKSRKKTKPSRNAKQRRLQGKKKRGQLKQQRGKRNFEQE